MKKKIRYLLFMLTGLLTFSMLCACSLKSNDSTESSDAITTDALATTELTTNELVTNELATDVITTDDIPADELAPNDSTPDNLTPESVTDTPRDSHIIKVEERTFMKAENKHEPGTTTLTYIGHASVKIVSSDGTVIYIDPNYNAGDYSDIADIVLVTHGHSDHTPCKKVQTKEDTTMITWKESHPSPDVYEAYDINGIHIEAVPASNSNHHINNCVGYIVTVDGIKIYHAGDTSMLDSMALLSEKEIDFAMYPIDGQYNMNATEATEVAKLINAKYNIPIHEFDSGKSLKSDNFTPDSRLVLEYGDTIIINE